VRRAFLFKSSVFDEENRRQRVVKLGVIAVEKEAQQKSAGSTERYKKERNLKGPLPRSPLCAARREALP
jgi:hypothetical protein